MLNVKFIQNLVLFGTNTNMKTDTVSDLVIFQAKQFTYKCKLDKCWPILSCFLQQVMSRYKRKVYKSSKPSGELSTFNLKWFCNKPIFKIDNVSVDMVILDLECKHTCDAVNHSMRVIQVKYLSMIHFIQLFVWMAAYMSVVVVVLLLLLLLFCCSSCCCCCCFALCFFGGVYYVCINCTCIVVYVCSPLCEQVYWTGVLTYVFLLYYSCYNKWNTYFT